MRPLYLAGTSPKASKEIVNLGSNMSFTVLEAAEILMDVIGGGSIQHIENRHEVHTASADNSKSYDILEYQHNTSFIEGLTDMYEWVLKNPCEGETVVPQYEITKGMYNAWKK